MEISNIINCLKEGGVVLLPTDTVYGLAVKPDIEKAVTKIYELKSRPRHMFLPVMVGLEFPLTTLGLHVNNNAEKLLHSHLVPGAITIVFGFDSTKLRVPWLNTREEVAIRIPNDNTLLSILHATGPLLVTSANRHGSGSTPNNIDEILRDLNGSPDLIVDGGIKQEIPSSIINCRVMPPVIERKGIVPSDEILKLLNNG